MSKQPLYLHELVNDTVPLLAYEFEQHQINLAVNVNGEPYLQSLDEVGMQQLLLNLLKNAFDACVQRLELEPVAQNRSSRKNHTRRRSISIFATKNAYSC